MHAILFSLPGSPVLYYGDEIAMGDNVFLGDRDGVRTPMQWTGDRNGGFSRADFAQLYAPPLMDPVYGYQAVNVEAQLRMPTSFLRWLKRFIALRKEHPVFGLGSYEPLNAGQHADLRPRAPLRGGRRPLRAQPRPLGAGGASSTCRPTRDAGPRRCSGRTRFPRIGELPYLLTLAPRGWFWFLLTEDDDAVADDGASHDRCRPGPRRPERAARGRAGRVAAAAALVRLQEPRRRRGARRRVGAPARGRRRRWRSSSPASRRASPPGPTRSTSSSWPWTPPARARRRSRRSAA